MHNGTFTSIREFLEPGLASRLEDVLSRKEFESSKDPLSTKSFDPFAAARKRLASRITNHGILYSSISKETNSIIHTTIIMIIKVFLLAVASSLALPTVHAAASMSPLVFCTPITDDVGVFDVCAIGQFFSPSPFMDENNSSGTVGDYSYMYTITDGVAAGEDGSDVKDQTGIVIEVTMDNLTENCNVTITRDGADEDCSFCAHCGEESFTADCSNIADGRQVDCEKATFETVFFPMSAEAIGAIPINDTQIAESTPPTKNGTTTVTGVNGTSDDEKEEPKVNGTATTNINDTKVNGTNGTDKPRNVTNIGGKIANMTGSSAVVPKVASLASFVGCVVSVWFLL